MRSLTFGGKSIFSLQSERSVLRALLASLAALVLWLAGCAAPPPPPAPVVDETLAGAINAVLLDMARQLEPLAQSDRTLAIDALLDGRSGQQTQATERTLQLLNQVLPTVLRRVKLLPFSEQGAKDSRWLINGTLTQRDEPGRFGVTLALSDRASGLVMARAMAPFSDAQLDVSPTRFYGESPSLVRDRPVDGYLHTTDTPAGNPVDAPYLEQIATAALLAEAAYAYNTERWGDALRLCSSAVQRTDGQQLRTLNGLYLTNAHLGRGSAAEEAFGKIAALGLATNNLAVKLFFRPGSVEFLSEGNLSAPYPMWLRQIARAAQASALCLNVGGMDKDVPGTARRAKSNGQGSRENLIGTGTDDLLDAPDRRVEFKVIACA